ncbi:MAG: tryptophan 7-halogenase, partial [Caldilineaceae bacterium]|nr:tryptophan 7-halogenase [Caldilineaceae bacterium]
ESMILETSEAMRALAEFYDVPELAWYSSENFYSNIGVTHGVKRHFSFLHHRVGAPQDVQQSLQAVIPKLPYGHELHIYRQDSDYLLTALAISYGATILQGTLIQEVKIEPNGVDIVTNKGVVYKANYVVDAGGMRSLVANAFDWRHRDLLSHSRTIVTHMIDVPCFHEDGPSQAAYKFPYPVSQGTLHHVFHGGWLWIIPFNNHPDAVNPLCSVGMQLDPRIHPQRNELSAADEFYTFLEQFPSMRAQLAKARPVRDWQRIDRLQYSAHQIVGDRCALLAHAAGFVDPLYSKGLYLTHMSIFWLVNLLLKARQSGDYSATAFAPLQEMTLGYLRMHDRLVASSFKAWSNYKLWQVYAVLWLLGAYLEYVRLIINRYRAQNRADYLALMRPHRLAGGGFDQFFALQEHIDALIDQVDPMNEADVDSTVAQIKALFRNFPWLSSAFQDLLDGKNYLPDNKLRLNLLARTSGFMGNGAYRAHFFGDKSLVELIPKALADQARYSAWAVKWRRRQTARVTGKP